MRGSLYSCVIICDSNTKRRISILGVHHLATVLSLRVFYGVGGSNSSSRGAAAARAAAAAAAEINITALLPRRVQVDLSSPT